MTNPVNNPDTSVTGRLIHAISKTIEFLNFLLSPDLKAYIVFRENYFTAITKCNILQKFKKARLVEH